MLNYALKVWLFPSVCFILFLYGMIFLIIYSYDENITQTVQQTKKELLDGNAIKNALKKIQ